ncbi:uncharacterized protein BXIN_0955 [Babesia sp. Xinjiang]|uniref:uncharacterized protein n=1 Tax=Babesia sp. Xinjiang TaxID=462227 RepID=UPI000A259D7D|nr:uncharacterized protein BXIN_0955 [Babesia sp. Xinjiang]ORM42077.1 hypothetical protein BXIN_0955 [Babesia sp. Xinjiang]
MLLCSGVARSWLALGVIPLAAASSSHGIYPSGSDVSKSGIPGHDYGRATAVTGATDNGSINANPLPGPSSWDDPNALSDDDSLPINGFDRFASKLFEFLLAAGKALGHNVWNVVAFCGDSFLDIVNRLQDLFGTHKLANNPYMYSDYEEEFDYAVDKETAEYLDKILESSNSTKNNWSF